MKLHRPLFLLLVALLAAAFFALQSQASSTGWKTERYYSKETWHSFSDIGKQDGGGPTDIYVTQETLSGADGKQIGIVNGYGVNLHPPYVFFHYTGVVGSSTITLEGAVNLKNTTGVMAIVGGTGRYANVRGTVTTSDAGSKGSLVVIRYRN